jgi:TonB family protein
MARPIREEGRVASAWILSIVGHGVALGLTGLLLAFARPAIKPVVLPSIPAAQPSEAEDMELPTMLEGAVAGGSAPARALPAIAAPRGGGEGTPRLDSGTRGKGGTDTAADPALNLADRDEGVMLSPDMQSRLDRSQIQRVRSADHRSSREDYRAAREPMELTFLASGRSKTDRPERRAPSDHDPSSGAADRGAPQRGGGALGGAEQPPGVGDAPRAPGGLAEGADRASAGLGVRDGAPGDDHRASAKVAFARPDVQQGTPSVPASVQGKPADTLDAEQEVAAAVQAIVHASTAGGAAGPGSGGQAGPGAPGAGGLAGAGSIGRALGTGKGPGLDDDPRDKRRSIYTRQIRAKLDPLWSFPKWAALEGMQGRVIVTFTVLSDGRVAGASVTRPSGIPEFDENCRAAVLRASPFAPLPAELGTTFTLAWSFDAGNPAVRPKAVKPLDAD